MKERIFTTKEQGRVLVEAGTDFRIDIYHFTILV